MKPVYSRTFFLSASDANAQAELSLPLLAARIIDIATYHANSIGIGNPAMEHLGFGWVLTRLAIEMERYPKVNEEYTLSTWIESWNRHFSVRNFSIADKEGNVLGYATSVWMVLNRQTRENAGTSHLSLPENLISGAPAPIDKFGKHKIIVGPGDAEALERHPGALEATAEPKIYTFSYPDLDFYRHVNTVRYVAMLMGSYSLDEMDSFQVKRLELAFMREGRYGETVRLLRHREDLHTSFALSDVADGTALFSASLLLRPRTRS